MGRLFRSVDNVSAVWKYMKSSSDVIYKTTKTPKILLNLVKKGVKIECFVKYFVVLVFLRFLNYTRNTVANFEWFLWLQF